MGALEQRNLPEEHCVKCSQPISCHQHGADEIVKVDDGSRPFYYCGLCLSEYGTPLAAIVHDCVLEAEFIKASESAGADDRWLDSLADVLAAQY